MSDNTENTSNAENPYRGDFPILAREINGHPLSYLDNAATTQKPRAVIDALVRFYEHHNANVHRGVHTLSEEASSLYEEARAKIAAFIGAASPGEVIFTRGTTESLNMVAYGFARQVLRPGDEVLLTEMEHHSNLTPWQEAARETGAVTRFARITDSGTLELEDFAAQLNERTRLVALTHASNVLGTLNPVAELTAMAHKVGAVVVVDAAQTAPKGLVDVAALDCDFLAFSGHKMYGPTGIGVLYGKAALLERMTPAFTGGGMIAKVDKERASWGEVPRRFEPGTPPIAGAVALGAAVDYLQGVGPAELRRREAGLTAYALEALDAAEDVTVFGPPAGDHRTGVISFNLRGVHPHDVAEVLDETGVAVRAGHHCCQVLMQRLEVPGVVRASLGLYNSREDVERLLAGLNRVREVFGVSGVSGGEAARRGRA
ncbi:MAG: SufS family cysteine desulfurase [SAR324 cluster bacterium]|nr:SufS family cysteine desulfurase [SAR324 cluster bacterium]